MKFLDWKPADQQLLAKLDELPKSIAIFPHTSYWDIMTLSVYVLAHKELRNFFHVFVLRTVNVFPANYIFNNFFHAIPVQSKRERDIEGSQGTISRTTDLLGKEDKFCVLMSPEGTLKKSEWKSGYLSLALKLNVPILIFGFDFREHKMKFPGYLVINLQSTEQNGSVGSDGSLDSSGLDGSVGSGELEVHDLEAGEVKRISLTMTGETSTPEYLANLKNQIQPYAEELMSRIMPLNPSRSWVAPKGEKGKLTALGPNNLSWVLIVLLIILIIMIILLFWHGYNKKKKLT